MERSPVPHLQSAGPDEESLLRFVERFAMVLADSGMSRMPARVFAYVLAEDAERYTAAELARGLRVSLAAISGAVRQLVQLGLLAREREPGARSDSYRIYDDDVWGTILTQRSGMIKMYEEAVAAGVELLGTDSRGGRRLRQTREFYAFLRAEQPHLIERWRAHRQAFAAGPTDSATSAGE